MRLGESGGRGAHMDATNKRITMVAIKGGISVKNYMAGCHERRCCDSQNGRRMATGLRCETNGRVETLTRGDIAGVVVVMKFQLDNKKLRGGGLSLL